MKRNLKQHRVDADMTQVEIAAEVGVSQPTYQRWESGAVAIPKPKLKKLTQILKASEEALLGVRPPIEATLYDDSAAAHLNYYGEVAVHFKGGGDALLLTISDAEFQNMHRDLQLDVAFVTVQSLANQTVVFRAAAIADVYFSSEAYDDFGPEHGEYKHFTEIQNPDDRDWAIIEYLSYDGIGLKDFSEDDVARVTRLLGLDDTESEEPAVNGGDGNDAEIDGGEARGPVGADNERPNWTDRLFGLATETIYQLSDGKRRVIHVVDHEKLYDAFECIHDADDEMFIGNMIRLSQEGGHRVVFINKDAFDYVSLPTHAYNNGRIESRAAELDD